MGLLDFLPYDASYAQNPSSQGVARQLFNLQRFSRSNRMAPIGRSSSPRQRAASMNPFAFGAGDDYSAATYDPQVRAQAESLGIHPLSPDQVNPNALLPNTGFFGRRPGLARGLEGALFSVANTQGSDTVGEGISNVTRGVMTGLMERRHMVNNQFAAPFNQALMFEQIKRGQLQDQLTQSTIDYHKAQIDALNAKPTFDDPVTGHFTADDGTEQLYTKNGNVKNTGVKVQPKGANRPGLASLAPIFGEMGVDPAFATPEDFKKANAIKQQRDIGIAAAKNANNLSNQNKLPGQDNAEEPPDVKTQRALMQHDVETMDSPTYRDKLQESMVVDRLQKGSAKGLDAIPTDDEIDAEISKRKIARQKQFDDFRKNYSPNPLPKVKKYNRNTGQIE